MAIPETKRQYIADKFGEMFTDRVALGNILRVYDEATYEVEVRKMLADNGFPTNEDIDIDSVDCRIEMSTKNDEGEWADIFIDTFDINDTETFELMKDDSRQYDSVILENIEMMDIEVVLNTEYQEWIDEHPTAEYFGEVIDKDIDTHLLEELIPTDSPSYEDKVREALRDDGFSDDVVIDDVTVTVHDIAYAQEPNALAERYLDNARQQGGVSAYMSGEFFMDILRDEQVKYEVTIESDPEDFQ